MSPLVAASLHLRPAAILALTVCTVAVANCVGENKPAVPLPASVMEKAFELTMTCSEEAGVDPGILQKMLPWTLEESEANGKFLYCLCRKVLRGKSKHNFLRIKMMDIGFISILLRQVVAVRPVVHLPPAENEKIQKAAQECLDETGAQGDVAKGFFNLQIEPDDTSKNFLCCVTRKAHYSNLDGHLNNNLLRLFENSEYWDERPVIHLPPLVLKAVQKAASDCVTETSVKQEVSDNFFKLNFGSDADSKKFIYCLCQKTNYGNEDGHLNDGFVTLFEGSDLKDEVQKVVDTCNKNKESDNVETMHKTVQCFYKNTPVVLVV
ncbi:unnamed protein product, partial [Iphiclides podalirius]